MHANETPFGGTTSTAAGPTIAGKGGAPIWQPGPDRPQEIATAALFLAAGDSSFVNGVELIVDGGTTAV
jgi:NAD(P)-dependent dehydrogenase (short-subunit alcohol dehydrogenase family)